MLIQNYTIYLLVCIVLKSFPHPGFNNILFDSLDWSFNLAALHLKNNFSTNRGEDDGDHSVVSLRFYF